MLFSQKLPTMTLVKYDRAEVTVSDHRPVYAHFRVKVNKVDEAAKALVEENLIAKFNAMKVNQRNQQLAEKALKRTDVSAISDADFASAAVLDQAEASPSTPNEISNAQVHGNSEERK